MIKPFARNYDVTPMVWEEFRPIDGWPGYSISNKGRLLSINSWHPVIRRPYMRKRGYYNALLKHTQTGISGHFFIHRLVAMAFIPNPNNYPCINHINSDPSCNVVENLEWCTHKQNMAHAFAKNGNWLAAGRLNIGRQVMNDEGRLFPTINAASIAMIGKRNGAPNIYRALNNHKKIYGYRWISGKKRIADWFKASPASHPTAP